MTKVCLIGFGRTGIEIARVLYKQPDIKIVGAICSDFSSKAGKDIGEFLGVSDIGAKIYTSSQLKTVIEKLDPDVFVDFSNYKATIRYIKTIADYGKKIVIGTTGFSDTELMRIKATARKSGVGILYAPNITLGVNVMMLLSNIAARILNDYDFEISEAHHKHKKDVPSGTALKIADEVATSLEAVGGGVDGTIPIHATRAGGIVGRHQLMIAGEDDKIEITHESFSRKAFAAGALRGIRFIRNKSGYYEMRDVLNLEKVLASYFDEPLNPVCAEG